MTGPDIYTSAIFTLADLCVQDGCFPGLEDWRYILLLRFADGPRVEIHRADVDIRLPGPCRAWLAKGKKAFLLGDSHALPADLSAGVRPPFLG